MANVTQTIPNLTQGISQQPDEYKVPGQVTDMINCLPDVTSGLQKRPAGKFVASLSDNANAALNSTTDGKWFHYYRDEDEQYIGQVAQNGVIKMWACVDIKDVNGNLLHNAGDPMTIVITMVIGSPALWRRLPLTSFISTHAHILITPFCATCPMYCSSSSR